MPGTTLNNATPNDAALSKSQRAYEWIKGRITGQNFTPGYRLVLGAIAAELDMSVVPVREAIRQLEAEGLVTHERNVGAHVSMVDVSQYKDSMQTLAFLEGAATALAARAITRQDAREARAINDSMLAQLDRFDPHAFTELNRQFHQVLFERCPNQRLLELVHAEWGRLGYLRDSTFAFVPSRARDSVSEHEELVQLIEDAAPLAVIEDAARRHRDATLTAFMTHGQEAEAGHLVAQ